MRHNEITSVQGAEYAIECMRIKQRRGEALAAGFMSGLGEELGALTNSSSSYHHAIGELFYAMRDNETDSSEFCAAADKLREYARLADTFHLEEN